MEHNEPSTPTKVVAARMHELRTKRGWSADELARQMRAVGVPWERLVVTKLETGRRAAVSVAELFALAAVLNCPPVMLMTARDDDAHDYQITPTVTETMGTARAWIRGQIPLGDADPRDYYGELPVGEFLSVSVNVQPAPATFTATLPTPAVQTRPDAEHERRDQDG
jgi:transcriptional regulator with XRE-family HTH domain